MDKHTQLYAACVSIEGRGVLLLGPSGSGKSDLALRLIDGGARLVADDRVDVVRAAQGITASPPAALAGLAEARGMGILALPYAHGVLLKLAVALVAREAVERLPEAQFFDCLGVQLPLHSLHAFDTSAAAKIRLWLRYPTEGCT